MNDGTPRPLGGIRVLDLSRVIAGPFCTLQLADLGAEIVKIEHPERGDDTRAMKPPAAGGESPSFLVFNRSKRSVALDFATARGREILWRLIACSDVLVQNFRPGVMERLGFGYEAVAARHPRLVYCSISAYGQEGAMAGRPGFDPVIQAESGMMALNGPPEGVPMRHPVSLTDFYTALYAALGIVAALRLSERTGRGQHLDLALMDSAIAVLSAQAAYTIVAGEDPPRLGNGNAAAVPVDLFESATGPFYLAVGNDRQFRAFAAEVLGRPGLADDPRFARNSARLENRDALTAILREAFAAGPREHWLARLDRAGVPAGPVRQVSEALAAPEVRGRGMVVGVEHPTAGAIELVGSPLKLSASPPAPAAPPPLLGEHTSAVLGELLGIGEAELARLRAEGVIGAR